MSPTTFFQLISSFHAEILVVTIDDIDVFYLGGTSNVAICLLTLTIYIYIYV